MREEGLERAGRAASPWGAVRRAQPGGGSSSVPASLWLCHLLKLRWPAPQELTRSAPACPPDQPRPPNWARLRGDLGSYEAKHLSTWACSLVCDCTPASCPRPEGEHLSPFPGGCTTNGHDSGSQPAPFLPHQLCDEGRPAGALSARFLPLNRLRGWTAPS